MKFTVGQSVVVARDIVDAQDGMVYARKGESAKVVACYPYEKWPYRIAAVDDDFDVAEDEIEEDAR